MPWLDATPLSRHIPAEMETVRAGLGRRLGLDGGEFGGGVVDGLRRLKAFLDHPHVAFDHGAALAAELLGDLLAHLRQDGVDRSRRR